MTNPFSFSFFSFSFLFSSIVCFIYLCRDGWGVPWSLPMVADSWDRLNEVSVHPCNTKTRWKSIWGTCAPNASFRVSMILQRLSMLCGPRLRSSFHMVPNNRHVNSARVALTLHLDCYFRNAQDQVPRMTRLWAGGIKVYDASAASTFIFDSAFIRLI